MKNKNIVITGASGRLGSALSEYFSSLSFSVQRVSRRERKGFLSYGRLCSDDFLQQTDVILHLAWSSVPKISEDEFGQEWIEDIPLLVKLLQAIKLGGHKHIHFIFFSSAGAIYSNRGEPLNRESGTCVPANMYGWSKLHAEQILQQFVERFSLRSTILRISNVYGISSRTNDQQGVIPYIIKASLSGDEMCVWGDGSAKKDYIYISDLRDVVDIVMRKRIVGVYNVCSGKSYSILDIVALVERIVGKKILLRYTNGYTWDNSQVAIESSKIRQVLSWYPKVGIESGIKQLLESITAEA